MTSKKPPPPTDADVDAFLARLHGDLRACDAEDAGEQAPEPEDPVADLAAARRFLEQAGFPPALEEGSTSGARVYEFRSGENVVAFATRFGVSTADLSKLESCVAPLHLDDIDSSARTVSVATGVPILKVLRLFKGIASKRPAAASEPLMRAARRKPDGEDG